MIRLGRVVSIEHLRAKRAHAHGQVATFLLLVIVGVLILSLATANLGKLSTTATTVANAADGASLLLGSQLASQGNFIWNALGKKTEFCKKRGLLGAVLSVLLAVVVILASGGFATPFTWALMGQAAAAGAIGGAIGGGVTGSGVLTGAIQGAALAASIVGGPHALGKFVGKFSQTGLSATTTTAGGIAGFTEYTAITIPTMTGAIAGTAGGAATGVFGDRFIGYVGDRLKGDFFAQVQHALGGLGDKDRIREATFFQALSQTVDDPNTVQDVNDSDSDGDFEEQVPAFQTWWDDRITRLKQQADTKAAGAASPIDDFVTGSLPRFMGEATRFLGDLSREEVEGWGRDGTQDGSVVELARALYEAGYDTAVRAFWEPGPDRPTLDAWADHPDVPPGYDELDGVIDELAAFLQEAVVIVSDARRPDLSRLAPDRLRFEGSVGPDEVFAARDFWVPLFFDQRDAAHASDYYGRLGVIARGDPGARPPVLGLTGWKTQIRLIRDGLPVCGMSYPAGDLMIDGSPCQIHQGRKAEFERELSATSAFVSEIRDGSLHRSLIPSLEAALKTHYQNPKVIADSFKAKTVELKEGEAVHEYDYTFEYDDASQAPPVRVQKTLSGSASRDIDKAPAGSGLEIPESSVEGFASGVDAFEGFLNRLGPGQLPFATIDRETDDEFDDALTTLEEFLDDIEEFRAELQRLPKLTEPVGENVVKYPWTDSRGDHRVEVEVSDFAVPRTEREPRGNWLVGQNCLVMKDHAGSAKVTITRREPSTQREPSHTQKGLWNWNPFAGSITKSSTVSYNYNRVELN